MSEQFNPNAWRRQKGINFPILPLTEQAKRLRHFEKVINTTLIKAEKEFQKDLNAEYDIAGVILFGSWIRGDAYKQSDLDMYAIAYQNPHDLIWDFLNRLNKAKIGISVDCSDHILVTESHIVTSGEHKLIGNQYKIVTPYQSIKDVFS